MIAHIFDPHPNYPLSCVHCGKGASHFNHADVCIAGAPAVNGVCGDPDCVCAPDPPKWTPEESARIQAAAYFLTTDEHEMENGHDADAFVERFALGTNQMRDAAYDLCREYNEGIVHFIVENGVATAHRISAEQITDRETE